MRKSRRLGLIIAKPIKQCPITTLGNLAERLGPVRANSSRQATRITNFLRAGYPANNYANWKRVDTIVVCAPAGRLPGIIESLRETSLARETRAILVCGPHLGSHDLRELAAGAATGSLSPIGDASDRSYFVEGHKLAVRAAKRLIETGGGRAVEIHRGSQHLGAAAADAATWMLVPILDAAVSCLRDAGLTAGHAGNVIEPVVTKSLRAYLKGGRRSWKGPSTEQARNEFLARVDEIYRQDPELALRMLKAAQLSFESMNRCSDWLRAGLVSAFGKPDVEPV